MLEKDPAKRPTVLEILEFRNVALTLKMKNVHRELSIVREKTKELHNRMEKLREKQLILLEGEPKFKKGTENAENVENI